MAHCLLTLNPPVPGLLHPPLPGVWNCFKTFKTLKVSNYMSLLAFICLNLSLICLYVSLCVFICRFCRTNPVELNPVVLVGCKRSRTYGPNRYVDM